MPVFNHMCGVNLQASRCEEMGAAVTHAIRNFNLENWAQWEISRMKPFPGSQAPLHQEPPAKADEQPSRN